MDGETKMITNGRPRKSEPNVVASFSELAHDVVELAELQTQLLKLDVAASWHRMRTGVVLLVIGLCLLLGCIPVIWLAIAESLVEFADWSRTAALAVACLVALLAAGTFVLIAWQRLKSMLDAFDRSREEFNRNLAWIKSSLRQKPAASRELAPGVTIPS
jgi:hypothetical protein